MTEPLFGCLPEIERELREAPHILLCLDFDGTLAPIVPDPANARMPYDTRIVLDDLALRPGMTLAVISGRALEDLQSRVRPGLILAGNHGLEIAGENIDFRHPQAAELQNILQEICTRLQSRAGGIPGAMIEDKRLTASVHYRNVARADWARLSQTVIEVVAPSADLFLLRQGKKVFEILPRVQWNKGAAVLWVLQRLRETEGQNISVCYIGDDSTDEFAFRELTWAITIRVGTRHATAARFNVRNTREVRDFLRWLSHNWQGRPAVAQAAS